MREPGPVSDPRHEVRFGLVLYGGVSLAVYIYGVVYEFYRLIRASRGAEENAWSGVLDAAGVTADVDIVSGASAGGINGILLGKALAGGGDLRSVRSLWIDDADLAELLQSPRERTPASLLRSARFEELVGRGLETMDRQGDGTPLCSAFDLFIAGTRLRPWVREFPTRLRQRIQTLDYRKSFQLKYRRRGYNPCAEELGYDRNDFAAGWNPTLGALARATSAFPAAFEPKLVTADGHGRVLFEPGEPSPTYYSDGGILQNKPFTQVLPTILDRAAARPVARWLVSVEPDPEHGVPTPPDAPAPDVVEVVSKAVFGIPRYQSIARDLEQLRDHDRAVERSRALLDSVDDAVRRRLDVAVGLAEAVAELRAQQLHAADYAAQRREQLLDELERRVAAGWTGAEGQGVRLRDALVEMAVPDADFAFDKRRLYRLLEVLGALVRAQAAGETLRRDLEAQQLELWAQLDRIEDLLWSLIGRRDIVPAPADLGGTPVFEAMGALFAALRDGLAPIRERTLAACQEVDRLVPAGDVKRLPLHVVFEAFELWDLVLLPLERVSSVGTRNTVNLARISPADAQFVTKAPERKLAGDALGHFGGFLKREWRQNDVLWGRLDAAEVIARMLVAHAEAPVAVDDQIRAVQEEIAAEELPQLRGDYRSYLENEYLVGEESLEDVPMGDRASLVVHAAEVVRNMARGVQRSATGRGLTRAAIGRIAGAVGSVLGFVLVLVRWPVLAIWGADSAVRRFIGLAILFYALWATATLVLWALGVLAATKTLWLLVGLGFGIFVVWGVLLAVARRRR